MVYYGKICDILGWSCSLLGVNMWFTMAKELYDSFIFTMLEPCSVYHGTLSFTLVVNSNTANKSCKISSVGSTVLIYHGNIYHGIL